MEITFVKLFQLNIESTPNPDMVAVRYVDLHHITTLVDSFIRWPINEVDGVRHRTLA